MGYEERGVVFESATRRPVGTENLADLPCEEVVTATDRLLHLQRERYGLAHRACSRMLMNPQHSMNLSR
jgi:hypothetical protein